MRSINEARYAELLKEKRPRAIRTEKENARALREVEALMARGTALSAEEVALLELWAALIERFEEERYLLKRAAPREILREVMIARGMTQTQVSKLFPSKGIASEVLAGKREISKAQALKLAEFFHVAPALFLDISAQSTTRQPRARPNRRKAKKRAA